MPGRTELVQRMARSVPIRSVDDAINALETAQAAIDIDSGLAVYGVQRVEEWLRRIVTSDNIHRCLRGRGYNLTAADAICHNALSEMSVLEERLHIPGLLRGGRGWEKPIGAVRAAREYLRVLAGEESADTSRLVRTVEDWSDTALKVHMAVGAVTLALPACFVLLEAAPAAALDVTVPKN